MKPNRKNNNIIIFLFLLFTVIYPQFSCAENTVQTFGAMHSVNIQDDNIEIEAMGLSVNEQDGANQNRDYVVSLALKKKDSLKGNLITLNDQYIFDLMNNGYGDPQNITSIDFGDCSSNKVLANRCVVTIEGTTANNTAEYQSYRVTVPYNHGNTPYYLTYEDSMSDMRIKTADIGVLVPNPDSGSYTINIENISQETINIKSIALVEKCISVLNKNTENLEPNNTYPISFKLSTDIQQQKVYDEWIVIVYTKGSADTKPITIMLPIKITHDEKGNPQVSTTGRTVVIAAGTFAAGAAVATVTAIMLYKHYSGGGNNRNIQDNHRSEHKDGHDDHKSNRHGCPDSCFHLLTPTRAVRHGIYSEGSSTPAILFNPTRATVVNDNDTQPRSSTLPDTASIPTTPITRHTAIPTTPPQPDTQNVVTQRRVRYELRTEPSHPRSCGCPTCSPCQNQLAPKKSKGVNKGTKS